jgi:UPF0755 protein
LPSDDLEEKKLIAGIIWKRYDEGIHLGIDATTRYEKVIQQGAKWTDPLYFDDFARETPYNTRKKIGLPPTAIANPGEKALVSAANPMYSENYYYLHDNRGKIHYGKTLQEHNANKYKYL